jgi:hypothetical protein
MGRKGDVSIVYAQGSGSESNNCWILLKPKSQPKAVTSGPRCPISSINRCLADRWLKFIQVHVELVTGNAMVSAVPADEAVLLAGLPGTGGPAVAVFGGPAKSKIFPGR